MNTTGPESSDSTTSEPCTQAHAVSENQRGEMRLTDYARQMTTGGGKMGQGFPAVLISSTEDSPAKTSASPETEPDWPETEAASSTSSPESLTLFDPPGCSSRTYLDCSPLTRVGTSESFFTRWPNSGTASLGACSTHATSECPSDAVEYSLSAILEATVDPRYLLSVRAAKGVLKRSAVRGRKLPEILQRALLDTVNRSTVSRREH